LEASELTPPGTGFNERMTGGNGLGMGIMGGCVCCVLLPATILLALSFASLQTIEYGLAYNIIAMSVDNLTETTAGLHFLGFGHYFVKYPAVIQTI